MASSGGLGRPVMALAVILSLLAMVALLPQQCAASAGATLNPPAPQQQQKQQQQQQQQNPFATPAAQPAFHWQRLYPAVGPSKRSGHTLTEVVSGKSSVLLVFGGCFPFEACYNDLAAYDTVGRRWLEVEATGTVPSPRGSHSASVVAGNLVYVFGGSDGSGAYLRDMFVLDTRNMLWSKPAIFGQERPSRREAHAAAVWETKIYIHGGFGGVRGQESYLDDLWVFDTTSSAWSRPRVSGKAPSSRSGHAGAILSGIWFLFGGVSDLGDEEDMHVLNTTPEKDGSLMWNVPQMWGQAPSARSGHFATAMGDNIVVGGGCNVRKKCFNDTVVFNTGTRQWTALQVSSVMPAAHPAAAGAGKNGTAAAANATAGAKGQPAQQQQQQQKKQQQQQQQQQAHKSSAPLPFTKDMGEDSYVNRMDPALLPQAQGGRAVVLGSSLFQFGGCENIAHIRCHYELFELDFPGGAAWEPPTDPLPISAHPDVLDASNPNQPNEVADPERDPDDNTITLQPGQTPRDAELALQHNQDPKVIDSKPAQPRPDSLGVVGQAMRFLETFLPASSPAPASPPAAQASSSSPSPSSSSSSSTPASPAPSATASQDKKDEAGLVSESGGAIARLLPHKYTPQARDPKLVKMQGDGETPAAKDDLKTAGGGGHEEVTDLIVTTSAKDREDLEKRAKENDADPASKGVVNTDVSHAGEKRTKERVDLERQMNAAAAGSGADNNNNNNSSNNGGNNNNKNNNAAAAAAAAAAPKKADGGGAMLSDDDENDDKDDKPASKPLDLHAAALRNALSAAGDAVDLGGLEHRDRRGSLTAMSADMVHHLFAPFVAVLAMIFCCGAYVFCERKPEEFE